MTRHSARSGQVTGNGLDRVGGSRVHLDGDSALDDNFIHASPQKRVLAYHRCPTESEG